MSEDREPESGRVLHAGGLVDETDVTLALYGDDLDPDELTQLLCVQPTTAFRKGDPRGPRSPPYRMGGWLLEVRGRAPVEPEQLFSELLGRFPKDPAFWQSLASRYEVQLRVSMQLECWNRGFELTPGALRQIADIGVTVLFDIYAVFGDDVEL